MKKTIAFTITFIFILFLLSGCVNVTPDKPLSSDSVADSDEVIITDTKERTPAEVITSESDPYSYVIKAWQTYVQSYTYDEDGYRHMLYDAENAAETLANGFQMRPDGFEIQHHYFGWPPPTIDTLIMIMVNGLVITALLI